ncbi:hypothetical protein BT93_E0791 [Corymbia citriodora subsp. variegata]|nr:hypothetical protein BT93_E0791 [Corymbia citriodora subsp. variegata]
MATTTTTTSSATVAAPSSSSRSFRIVFRTMQSLVLLVVLISAVIAIAWLILNPRPPAFRLDSLSLSGLPNASSAPRELSVGIHLTATNPNKKFAVVIQEVNPFLALIPAKCQLPLSSHHNTSSSEYYISKKGRRTFNVIAGPRPGRGTSRKRPFQFAVGKDLRKGSAEMSLRMHVSVEFLHAYLPSKRVSVEVECDNLSVGLSLSTGIGKSKDGGKDCSVRFA